MILSIEGSIGVGKSTLGPRLANMLGFRYIDEEPTSNPEFREHLDKFNEDRKHSINLQCWLTKYRTSLALSLDKGTNYILERSIYSDWMFTYLNSLDGNIDKEGWATYSKLYNDSLKILEESNRLPDKILYLRADPNTCFERMKNRNRKEESTLTLEYFKGLHEVHEKCLYRGELYDKTFIIDYNRFKSPEDIIKAMESRKCTK